MQKAGPPQHRTGLHGLVLARPSQTAKTAHRRHRSHRHRFSVRSKCAANSEQIHRRFPCGPFFRSVQWRSGILCSSVGWWWRGGSVVVVGGSFSHFRCPLALHTAMSMCVCVSANKNKCSCKHADHCWRCKLRVLSSTFAFCFCGHASQFTWHGSSSAIPQLLLLPTLGILLFQFGKNTLMTRCSAALLEYSCAIATCETQGHVVGSCFDFSPAGDSINQQISTQ